MGKGGKEVDRFWEWLQCRIDAVCPMNLYELNQLGERITL